METISNSTGVVLDLLC